MKDYIKFVSLSVVLLIVSCKGETQKEETQPTDTKEVVILPENLEEVKFEIDGMTCAFGCAKMITFKLHLLSKSMILSKKDWAEK